MIAWPRLGGLLLGLALGLTGVAAAEVAVPPLQARVTDLTSTLSAEQKGALDSQLRGIEQASGVQLAVLLVPSTAPESIEQYSLRVAEAWKLGRQGMDNGLLLLVAKNDRKLRIEVGYGLEGAIPDAVARRVIDETITPHFKQGDFAGGIGAGVRQLAGLVGAGRSGGAPANAGAEAAAPGADSGAAPTLAEAPGERRDAPDEDAFDQLSDFPTWLLLVAAAVGTALRWTLGPFLGGVTMGGLVGAGTWWVSGALETGLVAGGIAFVFVLVGISNWISIASSGRGGSRGGGGFSGGGGGFGGGGASGRW